MTKEAKEFGVPISFGSVPAEASLLLLKCLFCISCWLGVEAVVFP